MVEELVRYLPATVRCDCAAVELLVALDRACRWRIRRLPGPTPDGVVGSQAHEVRLDGKDIEAIAERVVERLTEQTKAPGTIGLASAAQVAKLYGVTPSWVYANKTRLGAVKLGDGPRARLRFDVERVEEELLPRRGFQPQPPRRKHGRPRKSLLPPGVELLNGRGRK